MNRTLKVMAGVAIAATLAGCATSNSGSVYNRSETRRESTVRMGVVESVRAVSIEGTRSGIGGAAGGIAGGVGGSAVGGGRGNIVGAVAGAVIGAVAGSALEEAGTKKQGVELTVRLDNGDMRAIVQEADEVFRPGERVRLLSQGGVTRVTH